MNEKKRVRKFKNKKPAFQKKEKIKEAVVSVGWGRVYKRLKNIFRTEVEKIQIKHGKS